MIPQFLYATNRLELSGPVIIQTKYPWLIAKVWTFKGLPEYTEFINSYEGLGLYSIPGYKISLTLLTTLRVGRLEVNPSTTQEIRSILKEMSDFYMRERIEDKPGFFQKYRL